MDKASLKNHDLMAEITGSRASIYDLFIGLLNRLPDRAYLEKIRSADFRHFLETCCDLSGKRFRAGVDLIKSYQKDAEGMSEEDLLLALSVDRTTIMRGTGPRELKPPYEGLYNGTGKKEFASSLLEIKQFYRRSGLMPEDSVNESPDYICIELDFMKQLCLKEQAQWSESAIPREAIANEEAFLNRHLGSWAGVYLTLVEKHAATDFYRGFAMILDAFIRIDKDYLEDLNNSVK